MIAVVITIIMLSISLIGYVPVINWEIPPSSDPGEGSGSLIQTEERMPPPPAHKELETRIEVVFPDQNLESAIRNAIRKPEGTIYSVDLVELNKLYATNKGIKDVTGLEYCINLQYLDLNSNQITDISPLSGLTNLQYLFLDDSQITDISPLSELTNLRGLNLMRNPITDISPLRGLKNLQDLILPEGHLEVEPKGTSNPTADSIQTMTSADSVEAKSWKKTFGGPSAEFPNSAQQTNDGGYIIAGCTKSYGAGDRDAWLIKTNSEGDLVWEKTFGGSGRDEAESVQQTTDGGFIVAGYTKSYGSGGEDAWLIKTNSEGDLVWEKTFGGSGEDQAHAVQQTTDGGFIVAGDTSSYGSGGEDAWLIKTNSEGDLVWEKTFGGSGADRVLAAQQTTDGGFIIAGAGGTASYGAGGDDAWLIKTDSEGDMVWEKNFEGSFESVIQAVDGGYICAGYVNLHGDSSDASLVKIDSDGNMIWAKIFSNRNNDQAMAVHQTKDDGYIITGSTGVGSIVDIWLIKTDSAGNEIWNNTYGGSNFDMATSVEPTSEGGYIITGVGIMSVENSDAWLIKTNANGIVEEAG